MDRVDLRILLKIKILKKIWLGISEERKLMVSMSQLLFLMILRKNW